MSFLSYLLAGVDVAATGGTTLTSIPPGVWALVGTVVGTIGLRVVEKWLNRNKEASDSRKNIYEENSDLYKRIDKLEDEVTQWRQRYYHQEEQVALLRTMMVKSGIDLPERHVIPPGQDE